MITSLLSMLSGTKLLDGRKPTQHAVYVNYVIRGTEEGHIPRIGLILPTNLAQ